MKLIIVDDEVLVRRGIRTTIHWIELGIEGVMEASNGEQALALILEHKIDIVITDIKMPKMDGLELIEKLKIHRPETVVIVLSCVNDMESVRNALKFGGAIDYIPKLSMSTEELLDVVKRAIDHAKVKEVEGIVEDMSTNISNFLSLEDEEQLKASIEYEEEEDIISLMKQIKKNIEIMKGEWSKSREWEDIYSIFSTLVKKYNILPEDFFGKYDSLKQLLQKNTNLEEFINYLMKMSCCLNQQIDYIRKKNYDDNIGRAIWYIEHNYQHNIKMKEVAKYVNISEAYFSKHFKKIIGMNFNDYVNRYRIKKAKMLLMNKRLTIQDVSELTGYSNCSYFTQQFKEIEGITPKQYQKNSLKRSNFL